ncbi:phosphatidylserine synthase I [Sarcoptes scabiei]|nr:phosphatidylserine synthase I [Sarcoptes scabiei]
MKSIRSMSLKIILGSNPFATCCTSPPSSSYVHQFKHINRIPSSLWIVFVFIVILVPNRSKQFHTDHHQLNLDSSAGSLLKTIPSSSQIISIFKYPKSDDQNDNYSGEEMIDLGAQNYQHHRTPLADGEIDDGSDESSKSLSNLCDRFGGIKALGMESERIPDSALTASSAFEMLHVGPQNARLNKDKSGGAWCPSKQLGAETSGSEWIQVDLGSLHVVTGIATQGRYGKGLGQEFTEWFNVLYSRQQQQSTSNLTRWIKWKSLNRRSNLEGNIDPNTVHRNHLSSPIVAVRYIRLVPLSNHTRTVCLRFELFGCPYSGPISYTIPAFDNAQIFDPSTVSSIGKLMDQSYDGIISDSYPFWYGGLGELTDGIKPSQFNDPESIWIGWSRKSLLSSSSYQHNESKSLLQIQFEFDQVFNFSALGLNYRNRMSINHNAITRMQNSTNRCSIWFSLDSKQWSNTPIEYSYQVAWQSRGQQIENYSRRI